MRNIYAALILSLAFITAQAQEKKFSFFDCISVSAMGNYNFGNKAIKNTYSGATHFDAPLNFFDPKEQNVSIEKFQRKNYFSYDFDVKYYLKAYKHWRIGIGFAMAHEKLEFDFYDAPRTLGLPVHIAHFKRDMHFIGYSYSITYAIPKWRSRVTLSAEHLFRLSNSYQSNFFVLFTAEDGKNQDQYDFETSLPKRRNPAYNRNAEEGQKGGLTFEYRLIKNLYLNLRAQNIGFHADEVTIRHWFKTKENGTWNPGEVDFFDYFQSFKGKRRRISIGLSYLFFSKDNLPVEPVVEF